MNYDTLCETPPVTAKDLTAALRAAARRLSTYATNHGVFGTYEVGELGLSLVMRHGSDEVTKLVPWEQLTRQMFGATLINTEIAALRGISS